LVQVIGGKNGLRQDSTTVRVAEKLEFVVAPQDDTRTFDELVRTHRGRVFGLCYRYAGNSADAEDLVQEVFLRAYRGLPGFRGEASLSTWVYRIAVNVCLNWVASNKRHVEEIPGDLVDPRPSPVERLGGKEASAAVRAAVGKLPEKQRMTLVLRVYQELTHKEVAEVMGCPVGTAKANFFFALKNLRKYLDSESGRFFDGVRS
jgi:RNA polymerase sigma-70 factor (ECF subfamily)